MVLAGLRLRGLEHESCIEGNIVKFRIIDLTVLTVWGKLKS